jgi:DNA mismatch endonuclease (patch repair protein)
MRVRSLLHLMGYRFKLHQSNLPGKPDIILKKYKTVIFVNGCYWHRHPNCKYATFPKSNQNYWIEKFDLNKLRDKSNYAKLRRQGWKPQVVWECEIDDSAVFKDKLKKDIAS